MKRIGEPNYYIRSNNSHLLDILDDNYYIELGTIDMDVLNKLLKFQLLDINQIINYELLNIGIGKITNDYENDAYYQLNYLISLRQKSSSSKFFLTCETITYIDDFGCEKFAPLVLIPLEIDYQGGKVVISSSPIANRQLIKYLAKKFRDTNEDQNRFLDYYMNLPLNNVNQFDRFMLELVGETKCKYSPSCYITVCDVEYQDFAINNDYFNIERSIYETTDIEIIEQYFKNIHAVLPTNIDQKYAILKVSRGENLAIDGRLGTGKTYTILNILSDAISKGKKVLYVNQDLDNIWDVERNLKFLNLGQYIYNLTKNLRDIEVPKMVLPPLNNIDLSMDELHKLGDNEQLFDKRINGISISTILETYATIKNKNPNLKILPIEAQLEKHEIDNLYNCLLKVEKGIEVTGQYKENIWKKLNISHNNYTVSEITERTLQLYECQLKLNKEVDSFCKKYQLCYPKNLSDLVKLIGHINSFGVIKPLASWQSLDVRQEAKAALMEIQELSDHNYNATKYYENSINESYEPGRAQTILKELCGKTIKVKNSSIVENNEYIDHLLSNNSKLQTLVNQIRLNNEKFKELEKALDDIFNSKDLYKVLNKDYYNFFIKFQYYTSNYFSLSAWVHSLIDSPKSYFENSKKVNEIYKNAKQIRNEFNHYLTNYANLFYSEISELIHNRRFNQIIKRYFDQKIIKNDHVSINDLIQKVKNYYELIRQATSIVNDPDYNENKSAEEIIRNYLGLYELTSDLKKPQINLLESALVKYLDSVTIDLEPLNKVLTSFIEESEKSDHLATSLEPFNIKIEGEFGYAKCSQLYSYVLYLERVIDLKKELNHIFKGKNNIDSNHLFELIKYDELFLQSKQIISENDSKYNSLLGENYKGVDTVISEVGQILEHFDDFMERLNEDADVKSLFQEPTLSRFNDNAIKIDNIISEWVQSYKAFSLCFKGGKGFLQTNSLKENITLLKSYEKTTNHIEHILFINEVLKKCDLYELKSLKELIETSTNGMKIADTFLCSILDKLYKQICNDYSQILEFKDFKEILDKLRLFEFDFCTKNIMALKNGEEKKSKSRLFNIAFDDYNKIIETLIKSVSIFLVDVNIFNSNLDLSLFDLVIIDDGHLSSANKYNRLNQCKQCVVFGDKSFQSSYVNTLMKRINENSILTFHNRYIKMSSHFNNLWNTNNRYIYSYNTKITKQMLSSLEEFAVNVVDLFSKHQNHIINVVVGDEQTRRIVYTNIVKILKNYYPDKDIIDILCYNIRIINAVNEGSRYVNDVIIYYNDFIELEQNKKELIFKNFIVVSNSINIYYIGGKIEEQNNNILKNINNTIGKATNKVKHLDGISILLYNRLKELGITLKEGFGCFDIIINETKIVGVMIMGKANSNKYSLVDDYQYFYHEYEKNGWCVEMITMNDLINNFEGIVQKLIRLSKGEENVIE